MRRWLGAAGAAILISVASPGIGAAAPPAGRFIVVLADPVTSPGQLAAAHAHRYHLGISAVYRSAIRGYAATVPSAALAALRADPRVASVTPDRPVRTQAQARPTGVNRIDGDLSSTRAGNGVGVVGGAVAVIDTGIDLDHPDLNVVGGRNCSTGSTFDDGAGHGTHVAGTIGARDNGIGVVGVAPGVRLFAVRVLDDTGSGSISTVLCGVDFVDARAPANGGTIRVANMSIGGPGTDDGACGSIDGDVLHAAICEATEDGVTFVAAAGNSDELYDGQIPAAYDEVLTVTAVTDTNGRPGGGTGICNGDGDDTIAHFSSFAAAGTADAAHTIAAPGACIRSTWKAGGYRWLSGTSMASPHVAGAVALCLASGRCAGLTPPQIAVKLRADAAARPASYGYAGDPSRPIVEPGGTTRFYGYLAYAGGY
ncbi:MAG: S8 family serine peptidase [Actinomycetota bacterium]